MAILSFAHVEQTLEDVFPRHSRKALAFLSFLTGFVLGTALLSLAATPAIQGQPAVSLAQLNMQPARTQQAVPQPKARQFMQPAAASQPAPPALMGRREAAAAFAAAFSAFAALPAEADLKTKNKNYNTIKSKDGGTAEKPTVWGIDTTSNGRRGIYGDVKIPDVGSGFPRDAPLNPKDTSNNYKGPELSDRLTPNQYDKKILFGFDGKKAD